MKRVVAIAINESNTFYQEIEAELELVEYQDLFVELNSYNKFPELYDETGCQLVVASIIDTLQDSGIIENTAKNMQEQLVLVKLEKGYMVDNTGKIYSHTTAKGGVREVSKTVISTNEGKVLEVFKGKNFGGVRNGGVFTTKGIDPVSFLAKNGVKGKALGVLRRTGTIMDIFNIADFMRDAHAGEASLSSLPMIGSVIGLIVDQQIEEMREVMENWRQEELSKAKKEGLAAVKKLVNDWRYWNGAARKNDMSELKSGEIAYRLFEITPDTASQILQGNFREFGRMLEYNISESKGMETITILVEIRGIKHDGNMYIIKTFFSNDDEE